MQMTGQMKKILSGISYPANKSEIMDVAKKGNATQEEMNMVQKLPDKSYNNMSEVTDEIDKMGMTM